MAGNVADSGRGSVSSSTKEHARISYRSLAGGDWPVFFAVWPFLWILTTEAIFQLLGTLPSLRHLFRNSWVSFATLCTTGHTPCCCHLLESCPTSVAYRLPSNLMAGMREVADHVLTCGCWWWVVQWAGCCNAWCRIRHTSGIILLKFTMSVLPSSLSVKMFLLRHCFQLNDFRTLLVSRAYSCRFCICPVSLQLSFPFPQLLGPCP